MPNLKEMLEQAKKDESQRPRPKIMKGIRPDKILRGEIQFETLEKKAAASIELETESKRCLNGVENERTESKRGPEPGLNGVQTESKRSRKFRSWNNCGARAPASPFRA